MAPKTLNEAIALTEKKMDMTLDDIIKMSKKPKSETKGPPRTSNKSKGFLNRQTSQNGVKAQRFLDSRSAIRHGVLAQRRSNFQENQFPLAKESAKTAAAAFPSRKIPIRVGKWAKPRVEVAPYQRNSGNNGAATKMVSNQKPRTLDARFANIMKEQRAVDQSGALQQPIVGRGNNLRMGMARGRPVQMLRRGLGTGGGPRPDPGLSYGRNFNW